MEFKICKSFKDFPSDFTSDFIQIQFLFYYRCLSWTFESMLILRNASKWLPADLVLEGYRCLLKLILPVQWYEWCRAYFFPPLLYSYKMWSLTNEHIHSHILHTVKLLIFHVNISHRYLYCCLILCQNKCECILAVDCYQDCSAPPPISTPTVCQKLDYYCQKSGDDYHRVQRY